MDSIENLIAYYNKSEKNDIYYKVVEKILANIHAVKDATIYELAEMCYSSPATVSRLVKKLGFENYVDFKTQISYALRNYHYLNMNTRDVELVEDGDIIPFYFNFLLNNIMNLKDHIRYGQIAAVSDCLDQAEEVLFYAGSQEIPTHALQKAMIVSGKRASIYDDFLSQERSLEKVQEGTLIFAIIPNLLEMTPIRSILKRAKERGARILTICSGEKNEYAKYSDLQICFKGTKTSMDVYIYMILINLIKYDYNRRYVDHMLEQMY